MQDYDVVVAGAGPVGLAFAGSLAGAGLRIALVDPQPAAALADPEDDGREIALTDRSVGMLRELGAKSTKQLPSGWDNGADEPPVLRLVGEEPGDLS